MSGIRAVLYFLFLLAPACATPPEGQRFENLVKDYFEWQWRTFPIRATGAGIHAFDDRLDPTGKEAVQEEIRSLEAFRDRLESVDPALLDRDSRLDRALFADGLKRRLFELQVLKQHTRAIHEAVRRLGAGLMPLLDVNGIPLAGLVAGLAARLAEVPAYLEGVQEVIGNPPPRYVRVAAERTKGLENLVSALLEHAQRPPNDPYGLETGGAAARAALSDFRHYLEKELLPRSTGSYRLGVDLYEKAFDAAYRTEITPADLLRRAEEAVLKIHGEMYQLACKLHPAYFPGGSKGPDQGAFLS